MSIHIAKYIIIYNDINSDSERIEYYDDIDKVCAQYQALLSNRLVLQASVFAVAPVMGFDKDLIPNYDTGKQAIREVQYGNQ